jgi:nicotinate-nucleotide pyrophosphorylase (carboxylating)
MFTSAELDACKKLVALALAEDLGATGDCTSNAVIPAEMRASAAFVARSPGVLAGLPTVKLVCAAVDSELHVEEHLADGTPLMKGSNIATVSGPLRSLLAAERTALNFLQRLSGIASLTKSYVDLVPDWKGQLLDTRKTTPGWRLLEKYAVRMGGGHNHRIGLYDAILIKDNHIAGVMSTHTTATPVRKAVELVRSFPGNAGLSVEVEVDTLEQLKEVLPAKPEIVLLDNMVPEMLRAAVAIRNELAPDTLLEASGGITKQTLPAIAATGIDRISIGALTHSAPALDIGLDYLPGE